MNPNPIRILVHGASGRMGQALLRLIATDPRFQLVAAVSRSGGSDVASFRLADIGRIPAFDVAIDFSLPEAFDAMLAFCQSRDAALVSGTTGLSELQRAGLDRASASIPVLWASNFSLGVAVLEDLVRRASAALPAWQVQIRETHHLHKKDAPSGTALTLARAVEAGSGVAPSIESLREGEVVGEHQVRLVGPGEILEFSHSAGDRDIFALGALHAASLLAGRGPGQYRLGELLLGSRG